MTDVRLEQAAAASVHAVAAVPARPPLRRITQHWPWLAIVVLSLAPLFFKNNYVLALGNLALINAIMAMSLTLLLGTTGQLSLGHAAFYALGAYVSANLCAHWAWSPYMSIPVAMLVVGAFGFGVARLFLRLSGYYLAVATLGVGILLGIVLRNEQKISGGPDGMPVVALEWFGSALSERTWYWVFLTILVIIYAGSRNLLKSPAGRALRSLHDADIAAQTCGVDTDAYKVKVFVLSCALAGLMGALYAHYTSFITPAATSIVRSLEYVMMVVIGGIGSLAGAVVGAVIVTLLPQILSGMEQYETLLVGSILLGSILLLPSGIIPTLDKLKQRFQARLRR